MEYSNILREILEGIGKGEFAIFCGAGISFNSGLPVVKKRSKKSKGSKGLMDYILEKLMDNEEDIEEILNSKLPFEAFMEILAENSNISKILEIFKQGEPNINHILIAKLAKAGLIKTIATTNFDILIEKALEEECKDFDVYYTEEQFSNINFDELNKSNKISVFKLHGSIKDEKSIRTTMKAIASKSLSEKRMNIIRHIFSNENHKNVLILGYSCSDLFDITPQIQSIENSKNKIFLIKHDDKIQEPEIKDINQKKLNGKENPFNRFPGYIIELNTDNLVKEIWSDNIKEKYELKKNKIEWQRFVDDWSNDLGKYKGCSICGMIFHTISDFKKAIGYHEESLKICLEIGNKLGEGNCYGNLGDAYYNSGDFRKAIEYHMKSLKIYLEIGDKLGEGVCYRNLGVAHQHLGEFDKAIEYSKKGLKVALEIGDKETVSICYRDLAGDYRHLKDFEKAIEYNKRALRIAKEIGSKIDEAKSHRNLGNDYRGLKDFKKAIKHYKEALKIAKEIDDKRGEAKCYRDLCIACLDLKDFRKAVKHAEKSLELALEIRNKEIEAQSYLYSGVAHYSLGDFKKAIEYYLNAEKIFKEIGQEHYLKVLYGNMANAYYQMNNLEKAAEYKRKAEEI